MFYNVMYRYSRFCGEFKGERGVVTMNESNEFYREEIARILNNIQINRVLKCIYIFVKDVWEDVKPCE